MPTPEIPHSEVASLAALENMRHSLGRGIESLQSAILAQSVESEALRRQLKQAQAQNDELEAAQASHATEVGQLKLEIEKRDLEIAQFQNRHAALESQHEEAKTENGRLTGELANMVGQLQEAHTQSQNLQEQVTQLHSDLSANSAQEADLPHLSLKLGTELTGAEVGLFTEKDGDGVLARLGFETLSEELAQALYRFTRQVAEQEEPLVINESNKLPDGAGLINLAALPVATLGQQRGVLLLANKRSGPFTEQDTRILLAIGQHAGLAMHNARLHRELNEAYIATVAVLADAIEAKDAYTRGHCEEVSRLGVEVGKRLGLNREVLGQLRYAALLHDVGKIGVPDGILLKPGRLVPEEYSVIQKHARIGSDLVSRVPALLQLGEIILHHHEKWDGSGYPEGLAGEGIPLISRIVCAVDAFDAMTTPRPYRTPVSFEEALEEMRRCSGTHFDPQIVELMAEVIHEGDEQQAAA